MTTVLASSGGMAHSWGAFLEGMAILTTEAVIAWLFWSQYVFEQGR